MDRGMLGEGLGVCRRVDPTPRPVARIDLGGRRIVVVVDGEAATRIDHMIQNGRLALVPGVSPAQRERQAVEHLVRAFGKGGIARRSEEHTSELQSLMRNSYAVFCLKQTT